VSMSATSLGDLVGYAPWPNEVIARLRSERIPVVMGNYDDGTGFDRDDCGCAYVDPTEKALGDESFGWTKAHTSVDNKAWLRALAQEIRFEADGQRFLLVHGSPRRMNEYLYEDKADATFARIGRCRRRRHRLRPHASAVRQEGRRHAVHQCRLGR
jgi:hypothetical protein